MGVDYLQLKIRLPAELKAQIEALADKGQRSMNAEIVDRLEESVEIGQPLQVIRELEAKGAAQNKEIHELTVELNSAKIRLKMAADRGRENVALRSRSVELPDDLLARFRSEAGPLDRQEVVHRLRQTLREESVAVERARIETELRGALADVLTRIESVETNRRLEFDLAVARVNMHLLSEHLRMVASDIEFAESKAGDFAVPPATLIAGYLGRWKSNIAAALDAAASSATGTLGEALAQLLSASDAAAKAHLAGEEAKSDLHLAATKTALCKHNMLQHGIDIQYKLVEGTAESAESSAQPQEADKLNELPPPAPSFGAGDSFDYEKYRMEADRRHRYTIDTKNPDSTFYWMGRLHCTESKLVEAVKEVGSHAYSVARHLRIEPDPPIARPDGSIEMRGGLALPQTASGPKLKSVTSADKETLGPLTIKHRPTKSVKGD